jgi:hypothetical protein
LTRDWYDAADAAYILANAMSAISDVPLFDPVDVSGGRALAEAFDDIALAAARASVAIGKVKEEEKYIVNLSNAVAETVLAMGEALAGGEDAWKQFGRTVLNTIASMLEALARQMLAKALADIAMAVLNPAAAIAAAAAALIAAGAIRAMPMAEGGIVTSPTHALIGEAGPEAVIPLDKMGNFAGVTINVAGSIMRERDVYKQADKWRKRAYAGY